MRSSRLLRLQHSEKTQQRNAHLQPMQRPGTAPTPRRGLAEESFHLVQREREGGTESARPRRREPFGYGGRRKKKEECTVRKEECYRRFFRRRRRKKKTQEVYRVDSSSFSLAFASCALFSPLRLFLPRARALQTKMDSGASFSEPKISAEPLKAVQVRGKDASLPCFAPSPHPPIATETLWPPSAPSEQERSFCLARREQRDALSRKGRRTLAGVVQESSAEQKENEEEQKRRRRRSLSCGGALASFPPPVLALPSPSPDTGSSFSSREEQRCRALHLVLGEERERARAAQEVESFVLLRKRTSGDGR